jgi:DNA topoisomerase-1
MSFLAPDELKLYSLIWKRFVSSQMTSAVYSLLSVHINASDYDFRAGGSEILFDGYLRIYREQGENIDTELAEIPPLRVGEEVSLLELIPDQHFTKPPARYSDASLVKELEEKGIGRPSTYAPIIRTIIDRNYVRRIQKYFQPTELGEMVNEFLMANFHEIVDYEFTAKMEGDLDEIESGNKEWLNIVRYFYEPFALKLVDAQAHVKEVKKKNVESDQKCDLCGKTMVVKWGRRGQFLSCSAFPNCRFSKSITTGVKCPVEGCSGELIERKSKRGSFFGCVNFPKCTYIAKVLPGKKVEETSDDTVEDE